MSSQISDQSIKALFDKAEVPLGDDAFTANVLSETAQLKRRVWIRRGAIGTVIFLASLPFQEYIVLLSEVLLVSLVEMPEGQVAQMLAPVNSVGGLVSVLLLAFRAFHKRLFHR